MAHSGKLRCCSIPSAYHRLAASSSCKALGDDAVQCFRKHVPDHISTRSGALLGTTPGLPVCARLRQRCGACRSPAHHQTADCCTSFDRNQKPHDIDKEERPANQVRCSKEERATSGYPRASGTAHQRTLYLLAPCRVPASGSTLLRPSTMLSTSMPSCTSCAMKNADMTDQHTRIAALTIYSRCALSASAEARESHDARMCLQHAS